MRMASVDTNDREVNALEFVPEPARNRAGLETGDRSRRVKRLLKIHQRTVIGLTRDSARIHELDQFDDPARLCQSLFPPRQQVYAPA